MFDDFISTPFHDLQILQFILSLIFNVLLASLFDKILTNIKKKKYEKRTTVIVIHE